MKKLLLPFFMIFCIALTAQVPHMGSTWILNNDGTQANAEDIDFQAWLNEETNVTLDENSGGCTINPDFYGMTVINVQCATFPAWQAGDVLHIRVTHTNGTTGSDSITLTNAAQDWSSSGITLSAPVTNPTAASNPTPANASNNVVIDVNLSWDYNGSVTPDGFKLYLGTDNPPTNMLDGYDAGDVLSYDPDEDLSYHTTYYWQIVPYTVEPTTTGRTSGRTLREAKAVATSSVRGDAVDCPIWSFTTVETPGSGSGTTAGTAPTPIPIEPITLPAGTISGNAVVTPPGDNGGAGYTVDFQIGTEPANGGLQNPDNVAFTYIITIGGAQVGDVFVFELPYVGTPSDELVWFDGVSWAPVTAPQWDSPSAGVVTFSITITNVTRDGSIEVAFNDGESALPVTLTCFYATPANETSACIQWTVESESGIIGYHVLRSQTDYSSSQSISELIRAENTPFSHSYDFVDDELEYQQRYYYWLESVNADGTSTLWGPQDITLQGLSTPQLPQVTALQGNFPNPFNPSTMMKFNVKENETAQLVIYNTRGQQVLAKIFSAGYHEFEWNAEGEASGLYFYKLISPSYSQVNKMMLLK